MKISDYQPSYDDLLSSLRGLGYTAGAAAINAAIEWIAKLDQTNINNYLIIVIGSGLLNLLKKSIFDKK